MTAPAQPTPPEQTRLGDEGVEAFADLRKAYADATPLNWQWGPMLKRDGTEIVTKEDVAETVAFSAMRSERAELWGVTLPIAAGDDASVVVCYTGNGPNAHNNARFIAAARYHVPALLDTVDALHGALAELVECARLRGDNDLPHPCDDPKLWTARMIEAWGEAEALVDGMAS